MDVGSIASKGACGSTPTGRVLRSRNGNAGATVFMDDDLLVSSSIGGTLDH